MSTQVIVKENVQICTRNQLLKQVQSEVLLDFSHQVPTSFDD